MLIVIADTGPLNYLLLVDQVDLLPRLFEAVYIPEAVRAELSAAGAPQVVRDWIASPPPWLLVAQTPDITESLEPLDAGEQASIALAVQMKAELLLIDHRAGVRADVERIRPVNDTLALPPIVRVKRGPRRPKPGAADARRRCRG